MLDLDIRHEQGAFSLNCTLAFSGRAAALLGPSGAGKSTVLKAIAGLVSPHSGSITVGERCLYDSQRGVSIPIRDRRIGFVFQDARLFPHLSVFRNLVYGAQRRGGASQQEVADMAEFLGIAHLLKRRPRSLSGGEAQRVAVGRALLSKPDLLLLDEPLSGLDEVRKADILSVLEGLKRRGDVPMLYVSHDREEVARLADEVAILEAGRCTGVGPVAAMLGEAVPSPNTSLEARLVAKDASFGLSELSISGGRLLVPQIGAPLGTRVTLEIAARDVMLARSKPEELSALNVLSARIISIEAGTSDARCMVGVELGDNTLLAEITERSRQLLELQPGQDVYAIIKAVAIGQPSGLIATVDT